MLPPLTHWWSRNGSEVCFLAIMQKVAVSVFSGKSSDMKVVVGAGFCGNNGAAVTGQMASMELF